MRIQISEISDTKMGTEHDRTVPNLSCCGLVMKEQQQWRLRTVQPQTPSPGWDQKISRGLVTLLTTRIFEEPSLQT
jgi:hypothetical protein